MEKPRHGGKSNWPKAVMLGLLAPEAALLATVNAHLLKKILPSKEIKIVGKNLKLYQDLGTQI